MQTLDFAADVISELLDIIAEVAVYGSVRRPHNIEWTLDHVLVGSALGLVAGAILGFMLARLFLRVVARSSDSNPWAHSRRLTGRIVIFTALIVSLLGGVVLGAEMWVY